MTKDNYSRNVSICCLVIVLMLVFLIGILSGFTIIKIDDKIDEYHYNNLLIIYDIEK